MRLAVHIAQVLYREEYAVDPMAAMNRIIISDMSGGDAFHIRGAIEKFQKSNPQYPFTAYAIDETILGSIKNYPSASGLYYVPELGRRVATWQKEVTIPMVSFFSHPDDLQQATTRLEMDGGIVTPIRLETPVRFNMIQQSLHPELQNLEVSTTFPIDILMETSKSELAYKFQQYLSMNEVFPLTHVARIRFYDFSMSEYLKDLETEEFIANLISEPSGEVIQEFYPAPTPEVINTVPGNEQTGIDLGILETRIIIDWNTGMDPSTSDEIEIVPPIDIEQWVWSND